MAQNNNERVFRAGPCLTLLSSALFAAMAASSHASAQGLPDAPSALLVQRGAFSGAQAASGAAPIQTPPETHPEANRLSRQTVPSRLPLCETAAHTTSPEANAAEQSMTLAQPPCRKENPIQPIVSSRQVKPLDAREKGLLALRDTIDPFNLLTITGYSAFAVAVNSHSAYGPGLRGWGRLSGYSFVEDAQGEFLGTFLISSIAHEDPRYHRLPNAPMKRRVLHALAHTWVSQHDDGRPMPNYATLLTYPISAELSDLYVPGVRTNLPSTSKRVAIGLATDPTGTLIAEFLPDLAKRLHIHAIFIQEILNKVATGGTAPITP